MTQKWFKENGKSEWGNVFEWTYVSYIERA
jgi:hypothetical protein